MGDPDVYCAICGGPVVEVKISAKPRSKNFEVAQAGEELEMDSDEYELKKTYDGEIITREEAEWTANVMVLGFNPNPKAPVNGAFLASFGTYNGFGEVTIHDTYDPNFDLGELEDGPSLENSFQCYDNLGEESDFEPVFPFHRPCYYVLRRRVGDRINGLPLMSGLVAMDKDILFGMMRTLADTYMLNIDYGNPQLEEAHWHSNAGEEIFAASPGLVKGLENHIRGMMSAGYFTLSQGTEFDLSGSVRQDPFQTLPFDIFPKIAEHCEDPTSLLNWAKASWFANTALRNAQEYFWTMVIRKQMGWFFELLPCLDDRKLCHGSSTRAIFLWADYHCEPRLGMKGGPFLRIANRRRIWATPCTELTELYRSKLPPHVRANSCEDGALNFREMLSSKATCNRRYVVTHNDQARLYSKVQKCLWVDEWEDTYQKMQVVEASFMRSNGFLTGIALTTERGECRMVGSINGSSIRFEAIIPAEDWICAMIVHIPAIELVGRLQGNIYETSPKGITIICKSGRELHLGETNRGYPVRALVARPGHQVVGLVAEMAADKPSATFTRLGLITLRNEELGDRRILHDHVIRPRHRRIDEIMWKDDGSRFFGTPYWNNPSIRILHRDELGALGEIDNWQIETHQELLPQEALIWAKDVAELRQLKRVSIFTTYSHTEDASGGVEVEAYHICGLGVDFSAEHTEDRRIVGMEGKYDTGDGEADPFALYGPSISHRAGAKLHRMKGEGNFRIDLDIDGPGGEIITEIFLGWGQYDSVNCLRLRTNRGREVGYSTVPNGCYSGPNAPEWLSIKSPPNKTIVGIIATFASGPGVSTKEMPRTYEGLTSLAALSMRLGIDEETVEESEEEDDEEDEEESDEEYEGVDDEMNDEDQ